MPPLKSEKTTANSSKLYKTLIPRGGSVQDVTDFSQGQGLSSFEEANEPAGSAGECPLAKQNCYLNAV